VNGSTEQPRRGWRAAASAVPIVDWLPSYDRSRLGRDVLAGAIVAALMVPQSLGYARIAGVPVQVGLYAVPLALLAYAVLGSSPQLIVGPASTVAIVSGSLVADIASDNPEDVVAITSALAIATGVVLIAIGLLRIGWIAEFLSKPIVTGFVFGLTLTIVIGELPTLLGIPKPGGGLIEVLLRTIKQIGDTDATTAIVGGSALAILVGGHKLSSRVPWGLVTLVGAVVASRLFDLESEGVATIGDVPGGLPPLGLPIIPRDDLGAVVVGGATLALVAMAEGLAATRLFATRGGYRVETEYELVGIGAANIGAGLTGGLGVTGSLSKTAAADQAESSSQVTGLTAAGIVVLVLLAFTWFFEDLPQAVLSAIVVAAVWGLMDVAALRRFRHVRRADLVAAMVGIAGVVLFGPLPGLGIAIVTSLLAVIYRSSSPRMEVLGKIADEKAAWGRMRGHTSRTTVRGVVVIRLDAPLFWANATAIEDRLLTEVTKWPGTRALVLDLEATSQLETTSTDMLEHLHDELAARGVSLYLARVMHPVSSVLDRAGFLDKLGDDHIWHSISQCVRAARRATGLKGGGDGSEAPGELEVESVDRPDRDDIEPGVGAPDDANHDIEIIDDDIEIEVIDEEGENDVTAYAGRGRVGTKRDNVIDFYLRAFNDGKPREAAATHVGDRLVQHSTGVRDGADGFIEFAERFVEQNPRRYARVIRSIADGPYVFLHTFQSLNRGRSERVTTEFFANDSNDRIVEHWDVVAPHVSEKWSRRSVTDGPTDIVGREHTDDNKAFVRALIERVLIQHRKHDAIDRYLASDFIEHNASLPDGRSPLRDAARADGDFVYEEIVLLVGEGNFVATLCRVQQAGTPVAHVDIFRLEPGRIVEHWDNTEAVPPAAESVNSGKF
jgi:SulP family sulfate permease